MMIQNSFGVPLGRDATLKVLIRAAFQRFIALVKRMSAGRGDDGAIRKPLLRQREDQKIQ